MNERLRREIDHGRAIAHKAAQTWGWSSAAGQRRWQRRAREICEGIRPGDRVLDLGCGTGALTEVLLEKTGTTYGIDASSDLVLAGDMASRQKISIQDACLLGFGSSVFDVVVGSSVLHHLETPRAFGEIFRVLKPGGRICFIEPNMANPQIFLQKNIPWLKKRAGDTPHETAFFRWKILRQLVDTGFKNITVKNIDFLHPAVPLTLISWVEKLGDRLERLPFLREFSGSLIMRGEK